MQKQFLKVSDKRIVGLTGNIVEILKTEAGTIWVTNICNETFDLPKESTDSTALWAWATHPDRCTHLNTTEEMEAYQAYCILGGDMTYDLWLRDYRRHLRLLDQTDNPNPSPATMKQISELEEKLLY